MPDMQNLGSFIPDANATITPPENKKVGKGGIADVLMLVAIILLASSLAIATGVFLYSHLINTQVESKKASLNRVRNAIDKNTIENLKLLSKRLTVGNDILNKHNAVSEVFRALEQITLKSVQFTSFRFQSAPPDTLKLFLRGKALTVNAVAAQSKAFAANPDKFQNTIFSNLGFEKDGTVSFRVSTDINPDFINFVNLVLRQVNEGKVPIGTNQDFTGQNGSNSAVFDTATTNNDQSETKVPIQTDEFGNVINN